MCRESRDDWYAEYLRRRQAEHDLRAMRTFVRLFPIYVVVLAVFAYAMAKGWIR